MAAAAASPPGDTEAHGLAECTAAIEGQVAALPEVLLQASARMGVVDLVFQPMRVGAGCMKKFRPRQV